VRAAANNAPNDDHDIQQTAAFTSGADGQPAAHASGAATAK
jgi:hypothetical protein